MKQLSFIGIGSENCSIPIQFEIIIKQILNLHNCIIDLHNSWETPLFAVFRLNLWWKLMIEQVSGSYFLWFKGWAFQKSLEDGWRCWTTRFLYLLFAQPINKHSRTPVHSKWLHGHIKALLDTAQKSLKGNRTKQEIVGHIYIIFHVTYFFDQSCCWE